MAVACTTLLQQLDRGDHYLAKRIPVLLQISVVTRIRIQGFHDQKLEKYRYRFLIKNCNLLNPVLFKRQEKPYAL
jgi:hypothetical protein